MARMTVINALFGLGTLNDRFTMILSAGIVSIRSTTGSVVEVVAVKWSA